MAKFEIRIQHDEHGDFVVLPEEISYGTEVELLLTRFGDIITLRPVSSTAEADGSEGF